MSLSQELLRAEATRRILLSRPDLAARIDPSTTRGLLAAQHLVDADEPGEVLAAVVMRRFDPVSWVRGTCEFALGLTPEQAATWRRSFTRTVFLAGNPENLRERFSFDHVAEDGSAAWTSPAPAAASAPLRRLLKLFDGTQAVPTHPAPVVEVPGRPTRAPVRRDLYLATAGVTVAESLVSLNHLLVESVMDGLLAPGDRLVLRPVPRPAGIATPFAALRIGAERANPDQLRCFAYLTEGIDHDQA
ncbi:DUF6182 family protein [Saccharothrix deserti]|uniref:DUF6182 family protein n=1 Tax=Saccharothrix deserti TaxID=2593674 RepID=UPI00131B8A11|nr:DUF6182 family protein [Saccharothrix deserti]